jgi:hypothetical protein
VLPPKRKPVRRQPVPVDLNTVLNVSIIQAALILGLCRESIYREIRAGRLITFKYGDKKRLISVQALREWSAAWAAKPSPLRPWPIAKPTPDRG